MHRLRAILLLFWALAPARAGDVGESLTFQNRPATQDYLIFPAWPGGLLFQTAASDPARAPFDTLVLHGIIPEPQVQFEFSVLLPTGKWSGWMSAALHRHPNGRFWGKLPLSYHTQGPIRLQAVDEGVRRPHTITLYDIEVFDSRESEKPSEATPSFSVQQDTSIPSPPILEREAWGALPPQEPYEAHQPDRITAHHTAGRQTFDLQDSQEEVRFIQEYHMQGRGWIDIGYHFLIDGAGRIFRGRPEQAQGAHVKNGNNGNLGIVFMGNYHPPKDDQPQQAQKTSFVALARYLAAKYGFSGATLKGHRDYNPTACPGDHVYVLLDEFRKEIDSKTPPPQALAVPNPRNYGSYLQLLESSR